MNHSSDRCMVIAVSGDPIIEWALMANQSLEDSAGGIRSFTRICSQPGGVLLVGNLVERIVADHIHDVSQQSHSWMVQKLTLPWETIHPGDASHTHSVAVWAQFPTKAGVAWRIKEYLGIDHASQSARQNENTDHSANVIVIDDEGLGFRNDPQSWPKALLDESDPTWVLLHMSKPVAQGALWSHLHDRLAGKLVVVIPVDELRQSEVQISRELSWERTAQDVAWELVYNPKVNALADCAHVIVTFNNAGAVMLSKPAAADDDSPFRKLPDCSLFFDPNTIEGMWDQENKGEMSGQSACLLASLACQLLKSQPDFGQGITAGLSAMRVLHLNGYDQIPCGQQRHALVFPEERIVLELKKPSQTFVQARVQFPTRLLEKGQHIDESTRPYETGLWTILQEQYTRDLLKVSYDIVERGAEAALKKVPLGKFGKLLTIDRREIEGYRSIRSLILEYCSKKVQKRPLSIAVFGPPGSGKSFGIKQIARSLQLEEIEDITFNLSQMHSSDELAGAFHRIRDMALTGKIPLVFWDEFDSALSGQGLGWLRYFLAPMQDGEFLDGQTPHPIGKAIFVFAGGTCSTIDEFDQTQSKDFKAAKGPDFVSRLRGYVNIYGANPPKNAKRPDPYYLIRRAILLRSVLMQSVPESMVEKRGNSTILHIDGGVLRAMLCVSEYKHGTRSMEAIIDMSQLAGKARYERSSLPSEAQLNLHVNGLEFLSLVQSLALEGEALEKMAEANHDIFCEGLATKGYVYGEARDPVKKTHPLLVPYASLPEEYRQSNRSSVRDIPNKLALIGYVMSPARSNEPPLGFPGDALEQLAEMEHDRYIQNAVESGWRYEPGTKKEFPVDPTLLPWRAMTREEITERYPDTVAQAIGQEELSEVEKEKDRLIVRNIPAILARVGYAVIKLQR